MRSPLSTSIRPLLTADPVVILSGSPAEINPWLFKGPWSVLASNEDRWREIFQKSGDRYQAPHLVLFRGRVQSACGLAQ